MANSKNKFLISKGLPRSSSARSTRPETCACVVIYVSVLFAFFVFFDGDGPAEGTKKLH